MGKPPKRIFRLCVPLTFLLLPCLFFWRAALARGVFYDGDVFRIYYPQKVAYLDALRRGSLPLWTPHIAGGYPLFAAGEVGALYPPNLLLYYLLPLDLALNYSVLLHFVIAGLGMYLFLRILGSGQFGGFLGGVVFAFSGFFIGHASHLSISSAGAWLPLVFALSQISQERLERGLRGASLPLSLLALIMGMQLLAGHPQISLLSIMGLVSFTLYGSLGKGRASFLKMTLPILLATILGFALAAVQLLPAYELTGASERGGGLTPEFFTSFSLRPPYLISLVHPFILGNPYPNVSVELCGYVGVFPLLVILSTPFTRRHGKVLFFTGLAVVSLSLALGRWNPLYLWLINVPIFNYFRVPARFLYLFVFAAAVLFGLGMDSLLTRGVLENRRGLAGPWAFGLSGGLLVAAWLLIALLPSVEHLLRIWRYLPWLLLTVGLGVLLGFWRGLLDGRLFAYLSLGLTLFDLYAYGAVYGRTYNATVGREDFHARPRSLEFLVEGEELSRIYTSEEIVPVFPVRRESLYPNISLIYGVPSANIYLPLVLRRYREYMAGLSPRRLNLFGVKYFLIPQLLPVSKEAEAYDLGNPFSPDLIGQRVSIPPTPATLLEVESFLSHSVSLPDGRLVAELVLEGAGGERVTLPLRAGLETAEWAHQRSDVQAEILHREARVVRTWPARSGFPPEEHPGHTYGASYELPPGPQGPFRVTALEVKEYYPRAYMRLDRVILVGAEGERHILAHLLGGADQTLAYRSEDVAIYENHDRLPRAFIVHRAPVVADDGEALALLDEPSFSPKEEVILTEGRALAGEREIDDTVEVVSYGASRVVIHTKSAADGYLVLTDVHYPGWQALVDGRGERVYQADYLFRAVFLPKGEHEVEFVYTPFSFKLAAVMSLVSFLILVSIPILDRLRLPRRGRGRCV